MFVDLEYDFFGRESLQAAPRAPRFSGFLTDATDVKWNAPVFVGAHPVGRVKAFEPSPTLGTGIGYVLFDSADAMAGEAFTVKDRMGTQHNLTLHQLPFFDPDKKIPRGIEAMEYTG